MSGIDGGSGLDELIAALDPEPLKRDLHARIVVKVSELAAEQYTAGQGPSGEAWPRNVTNNRFPSLRRLTAAIEFRATDDGIAGSGDVILRYHSPRTAKYAQWDRPTFPAPGQLSAPWAGAADDGAKEVFEERFGAK